MIVSAISSLSISPKTTISTLNLVSPNTSALLTIGRLPKVNDNANKKAVYYYFPLSIIIFHCNNSNLFGMESVRRVASYTHIRTCVLEVTRKF